MAYIGTKPTVGNFQICDAISVVNGQAAYTMQVGGVNVNPQSANHMIVSLNGTIQKPNSSFTVANSVITFSSNLATGDVIDFIQILGDVLDLGVPSDGTVTTAKLADNNITTAKLAYNPNPNRNIIINGDMSIAQRGTSAMDFQGVASDMRLNFDTTDTVANATPLMAITAKNKTDSVAQISMRRESAVDDGYIALSTQATGGAVTERVRIHSNGVMSASAGVALGVGTANTASNVLDDYEEGTWTPTFTSGGNTLSFSGGTETYTYTKIGNTCQLRFNIQNCTTSGTTATGDNRITIPFNGAANLRQVTAVINYHTSGGLRYTGGDFIMGEIGSSSSFIQLLEWTNSSGYRNISSEPSTGSGTYFWFTITYQTA